MKISELEALTEKFNELKTSESDVIWGRAKDQTLGDKIRLSVIITNYEHENQIINNSDSGKTSDKKGWPFDDDDMMKLFGNKDNLNENEEIQDDFLNMQNQNDNTFVSEQYSTEQQETVQNNSIFEPVMSTEPVYSGQDRMQQYGPQRIGSEESQYENNDFFNDLVNTPAILRNKRQEDFDMQNSRAFELDNDMSDFFKDIPD